MTDTITVTGYCEKCHNWVTLDFLAALRQSAHVGGLVCLNCLADKPWGYLKRHVVSADYHKVARYKLVSADYHKVGYKQFATIPPEEQ